MRIPPLFQPTIQNRLAQGRRHDPSIVNLRHSLYRGHGAIAMRRQSKGKMPAPQRFATSSYHRFHAVKVIHYFCPMRSLSGSRGLQTQSVLVTIQGVHGHDNKQVVDQKGLKHSPRPSTERGIPIPLCSISSDCGLIDISVENQILRVYGGHHVSNASRHTRDGQRGTIHALSGMADITTRCYV